MNAKDTTTLRSRLASGKQVIALRTNLQIEHHALATALGKGTYDLIYIDTQHVPYTDGQLWEFCSAAEKLGYPVEVRIPHTRQAHLVGRFCDFGPAAILVPETVREEDVEEALDYFYYPPMGKRSFGGGTRYGMSQQKFTTRTYADWWNDTGVLGLQLESVDAIINARLLAKSGVHYVSFGPNDLQLSLDCHPHFPLRSVEACIQHVSDQLKGTGIPLGIAVGLTPAEREKYIALGLTVFQEFPRA
jgi:2-keto-3-deoxy-L-rhamnonate aldolase RhmA